MIRVALVCRVLPSYRLPLLTRLAGSEGIRLKVFHGPSFPGTKVVNGPNDGLVEAEIPASLSIRIPTRNGIALAPFSPGLPAGLSRFRPDVIICEGASNLPNDLLAWAYAGSNGVPFLQWGLGRVKDRKRSAVRRLLEPLIHTMERTSAACIAYSRRGAEYYAEVGVPRERIVVATNVVDTAARKAEVERLDVSALYEEAHRDTDFVVLYVGGLAPEKRVGVLLDAFRRLCALSDTATSKARLWIVGDGPLRAELERRAEELDGQVRFFGQVAEGVSAIFVAADVFVLPGLGGLAISDAMAHGLPVIASIGDGVEADLVTEETGVLDEDLDVGRLAGHLLQLRRDPPRRQRLAAGASALIDAQMNIDNYVCRLREAIDVALSTRSPQ